MRTTVSIRNGRVLCIMGCEPFERDLERELLFDVEYAVAGPSVDMLDETVDYGAVFQLIQTMLQENRYRLIEYAVQKIAASILNHFQKIVALKLTLRKPYPMDGIQESAAAIEMRRL